jgi:alkanesulfonate monooxygenase SsuD/methylene tetrahydromethanopterin reductase-like flavin-dependent oxidoreductase (luciferase family)
MSRASIMVIARATLAISTLSGIGYRFSASRSRRKEEVQIGFNLPISGPLSSPDIVTRIARQGEALGYDYLTLTDHIVLPKLRVPGYPYSESGEFFSEGPERRHEQLTTAAYIAAKTSRIRLVLAVMFVPYRPAVLAAKMLATIDVLPGGRLVVGTGDGL